MEDMVDEILTFMLCTFIFVFGAISLFALVSQEQNAVKQLYNVMHHKNETHVITDNYTGWDQWNGKSFEKQYQAFTREEAISNILQADVQEVIVTGITIPHDEIIAAREEGHTEALKKYFNKSFYKCLFSYDSTTGTNHPVLIYD